MPSSLFPWRVAIDRSASYELIGSNNDSMTATFAGDPGARPVVGDDVRADAFGRIESIASRSSWIARARSNGEPQIVAANVSSGFIVTSPEAREFSPRRIVRYIVALRAGNVEPVVVLNKCDAADDLGACVAALRVVADGCAVVAVSARNGTNVDALDAYLGNGATIALCGSSGVGKSTLINRLAGGDLMETTEMREDGRGRHTTTFRRLIALPNGASLIDTPGMRAFTPWASAADARESFSEIASLSSSCRFRDCKHESEPGCAVREHASGERVEQWHKLQRELQWIETKDDPFAALARKNAWKAIHKANRARYKATGR